MSRKPVWTKITASDGKIKVKEVYEDSPEYVLPYVGICLLFLVTFGVSSYTIWPNPFAHHAEFLVIFITLFAAVWTDIVSKEKIFMPAFVVGCIWGGLSLIMPSVSFHLATYTFGWCCAVCLRVFIDITKKILV